MILETAARPGGLEMGHAHLACGVMLWPPQGRGGTASFPCVPVYVGITSDARGPWCGFHLCCSLVGMNSWKRAQETWDRQCCLQGGSVWRNKEAQTHYLGDSTVRVPSLTDICFCLLSSLWHRAGLHLQLKHNYYFIFIFFSQLSGAFEHSWIAGSCSGRNLLVEWLETIHKKPLRVVPIHTSHFLLWNNKSPSQREHSDSRPTRAAFLSFIHWQEH